MAKVTQVFEQDVKYGRVGYLHIDEETVEFDCSGGEYGPVRFPLKQLKDMIIEHEKNMKDVSG